MSKLRLLPDLAAGLRATLNRGRTTQSPGTRALSDKTPKPPSKPTSKPPSKPTSKPPSKPPSKPTSKTAQVPEEGVTLPITGNSAKAKLARSLLTKGIGRLIPGVGYVLTAVEAVEYLSQAEIGETAASERANYGGQMGRGRREQEKETVPIPEPRPERAPELPDYGRVKPAPGSNLKDEGPARSKPPMPKNRPSTVDTQSKKPIAKRIMEALGDNRTMEQATKDREMNKEMEREAMGRKKGGMAKKKKAPVKKAYGGMVKKKQGGSARKVNMKAGFTRRGCSKG